MKEVEGDLVRMAKDGAFDVVVHGCNCFCSMEAGIAKIIAREFPAAHAADQATTAGDRDKLGTITHARETFGAHEFTVVNAYTQFRHSGRGRLVDYDAVSACFEQIAEAFGHLRIGYPMIGAGLARGDWREISARISRALADADHTLVVLPK